MSAPAGGGPVPSCPTWQWGSFTAGFFVGAIIVFIVIVVLANVLPVPGPPPPPPPPPATLPGTPAAKSTVPAPSPVSGYSPSAGAGYSPSPSTP